MTITSGSQVRTVTLPPIADSTVPGATTTVPVSFAPLTGSQFVITFTARPGRVREELLLHRAPGPAARHRQGRDPRRAGSPDAGDASRATASPTCSPLTDSRSTWRSSGRPRTPSTTARSQVVPCGPDAKGITLAAGPPHRPDRGRAQPAVRQRALAVHGLEHRPARARLGGRREPRPRRVADRRPGRRRSPPSSRARRPRSCSSPPTSTARATSCRARTQPFEFVLGQSVEQGLAGSGHARARRRAGLDVGGPRDLAVDRRVRQRMAGHGGRPPRAWEGPTSPFS